MYAVSDGLKYPPDGVETAPTSHDVVGLREAARLLGKDPRTVRNAIIAGRIRGGAEPYPQRLRWYVYPDQLPHHPSEQVGQAPGGPAEAAGAGAPESATRLIAEQQAVIADQRAQIVALEHNNRLLSTAVDDLLDALEEYKAGGNSYREAAGHFQSAADGIASSLRKHRDALAQYTTPGHLGDLITPE
ncbi:hypothetical protein MA6G0728R_5253 [Mycobacteroides abscessus 6G-0728-R]|nr:hypothetical protein MA6G1108_5512 [Mycobacteroides abscessus 6G-1108]EIV02973.1 hypothetical protein MA6G0728R_5253 [Mycobacteroides abscessus 6G-0728-R]